MSILGHIARITPSGYLKASVMCLFSKTGKEDQFMSSTIGTKCVHLGIFYNQME